MGISAPTIAVFISLFLLKPKQAFPWGIFVTQTEVMVNPTNSQVRQQRQHGGEAERQAAHGAALQSTVGVARDVDFTLGRRAAGALAQDLELHTQRESMQRTPTPRAMPCQDLINTNPHT